MLLKPKDTNHMGLNTIKYFQPIILNSKQADAKGLVADMET